MVVRQFVFEGQEADRFASIQKLQQLSKSGLIYSIKVYADQFIEAYSNVIDSPNGIVFDKKMKDQDLFYGRLNSDPWSVTSIKLRAASWGLIFATDQFVKGVVQAVSDFRGKDEWKKVSLEGYPLGHKFSETLSWAEAVKSAADYVRHRAEWPVPELDPNCKVTDNSFNWNWSAWEVLMQKKSNTTANAVFEIAKNIGVSKEYLFTSGQDFSSLLAKELNLNSIEITAQRFELFKNELIKKFSIDIDLSGIQTSFPPSTIELKS